MTTRLDELGPNDFIHEIAADQNAFDLFKDMWICTVPGFKAGKLALFNPVDDRPTFVIDYFGGLQRMTILELGSFEGGHAYQLEKAGAAVVGIEANPHIFLRSLVVKNALDLRAKFLLGDFVEYLAHTGRYGLIFCSGVLYHMRDPIELIKLMADRTDNIFVWTHYVSEDDVPIWTEGSDYDRYGFQCRYYRYNYDASASFRSFAGTENYCSRLRQSDILRGLGHFGFANVEICKDDPTHVGGPAISLLATKKKSGTASRCLRALRNWERSLRRV